MNEHIFTKKAIMHLSIPPYVPAILLILIVIVFIALYTLTWKNLADKFGYAQPFNGIYLRDVSVWIDHIAFKSTGDNKKGMDVAYNDEGIYLNPGGLNTLFYSPIFIPWDQLFDEKDINLLVEKKKKFTIGNPKIATLTLGKAFFDVWDQLPVKPGTSIS
jgi:hypothetical protein